MFASLVAAQVLTLYAVPTPQDPDRQSDSRPSDASEIGRHDSNGQDTPTTAIATHLGSQSTKQQQKEGRQIAQATQEELSAVAVLVPLVGNEVLGSLLLA